MNQPENLLIKLIITLERLGTKKKNELNSTFDRLCIFPAISFSILVPQILALSDVPLYKFAHHATESPPLNQPYLPFTTRSTFVMIPISNLQAISISHSSRNLFRCVVLVAVVRSKFKFHLRRDIFSCKFSSEQEMVIPFTPSSPSTSPATIVAGRWMYVYDVGSEESFLLYATHRPTAIARAPSTTPPGPVVRPSSAVKRLHEKRLWSETGGRALPWKDYACGCRHPSFHHPMPTHRLEWSKW